MFSTHYRRDLGRGGPSLGQLSDHGWGWPSLVVTSPFFSSTMGVTIMRFGIMHVATAVAARIMAK